MGRAIMLGVWGLAPQKKIGHYTVYTHRPVYKCNSPLSNKSFLDKKEFPNHVNHIWLKFQMLLS